MRKSKLYLATAMLVLSVTGCSSSVDENPTTTVMESDTSIETTIDETSETTSIEEITTSSGETESETETKTKEETTEVETEETAEAETNEETSEEATTEAEESAEVSEGETEKDTETVKETEKETTVKETTVKETTVKETTGKPSQTEPTKPVPTKPIETKPVETTPTETKPVKETTEAPIVVVKPVSITVKINGSHYVGDTLSASDFVVTVTMSDGKSLTNPPGWAASTLKLTGTSTSVTVSYNGVSTTVNVAATEKPTQPTQPQQQPTTPPASTGIYDVSKFPDSGRVPYPEVKPAGTVTTYDGMELVYRAIWECDVPYVEGGKSHNGFDCSGLVWYVYNQSGISIPQSAAGQATCGTKIPVWEGLPGDIIVFKYKNAYHTGIFYDRRGIMIDAVQDYSNAANSKVDYRYVYNERVDYIDLEKIYCVRVGNNTSFNPNVPNWPWSVDEYRFAKDFSMDPVLRRFVGIHGDYMLGGNGAVDLWAPYTGTHKEYFYDF